MKINFSLISLLVAGVLAKTPPGFSPSTNANLGVKYGDIKASEGSSVPITDAAASPSLAIPHSGNSSHFVLLVDLDAPNGTDSNSWSPFLHWAAFIPSSAQDLPGNASRQSDFAPYYGPAPPQGTGPHRYVVLLFASHDKTFKVPSSFKDFDGSNVTDRVAFDIEKFALDAKLELAAANWFTSENQTVAMTNNAAYKGLAGYWALAVVGLVKLPGAAVFSLDLPERPRVTTIAKGTKSRSGCNECKRRRIKCDEGRPVCARCMTGSRRCQFPFSQNHARLPIPASLARNASPPDNRILVEPNLNLSIFGDQQQWDLFNQFTIATAQAGTLPINTLSHLTPQIAQQEPAVWEICCAIGAAGGAFLNPFSDPVTDEKHYTTSLKYYNHAIRAVSQTTSSKDHSLIATLSSILFVTYDMLRGDMQTALMHFNFGLRIAEAYFNKRCQKTGLSLASLVLSDFESTVLDMLQRLTTYPWEIEPSLTDPTLATGYRLLIDCDGSNHRYTIQDMPSQFDDLPQALRWWDVAQHHILHHVEGRARSPAKGPNSSPEENVWDDPFDILRCWHNSFTPLLQSAKENRQENPSQYLSACVLKALHLDSITNLHKRHRPIDILPDARLVYLDIIHTTRDLAQKWEWKSTKSMSMENAIIRPLVFVLSHCHDKDVRHEVRNVLGNLHQSCHMAGILVAALSQGEGQWMSEKLKNIERSFGWDLTACGCNSGVVRERIKSCPRR
ncbi:hypothetical protein FALBO_2394 [Fusarium albosuccineum]|uniref:Zn(2)-C6 fungal-type domain-containing protein n=1 Tax=Fusarium albosuccineum TaxID=1237068 RepID=A0A8H4LLK2_9HYPO|nr:hypothetical protein FALBO_2394 [Fusarium albosuccineum]